MRQEMRRADREVTEQAALEEILGKGVACHLALVADGEPYLVTLNYGFRAGTLYFHCANAGKKIDMLKGSGRVCFSVVARHELVVAEKGCDFSMKYQSVVGYGRPRFIEEREKKREALDIIMAQYSDGAFEFPDASLSRTTVFALDVDEMTAKSSY
jgi:nitroimidazol reductase NimA-like FMN-containing flavoprotein (pyridoxamine 5'-phosphate oxidase superfamily)